MALSATIFKADINLSDMDRNHYGHHALTLACHPSETRERMMVRLAAFLHHADERLVFTKGLSETGEPDLWLKDLTGNIRLWIETGLPDARRITRAAGRAEQVAVYAYGRQAPQWWKQTEKALEKLSNLTVYLLPVSVTQMLADMAERSMKMTCSIQDSQLYLLNDDRTIHLDLLSCRAREAVS